MKIYYVFIDGKDVIFIEGDNDGFIISNIWIDYNEFYSILFVDKDFYDGLVDSKCGVKNIIIFYNYFYDYWKVLLYGYIENDVDSDNIECLIIFYYNCFENIELCLLLFCYGYGYLYNNYYN